PHRAPAGLPRLPGRRVVRGHPRAGASRRGVVRGERALYDGRRRGGGASRRGGAPATPGVLQPARLVRRRGEHLLRPAVGARIHGAHDVALRTAPAADLLVPRSDRRREGRAAHRRGSRRVALPEGSLVLAPLGLPSRVPELGATTGALSSRDSITRTERGRFLV